MNRVLVGAAGIVIGLAGVTFADNPRQRRAGISPPTNAATDPKAKHAAALQRAADTYRRMVVEADKALVESLTTSAAPDAEVFQAKKQLADDQAALAAHHPIVEPTEAVSPPARNVVTELKIGMSEAECDAFESGHGQKGWKKVVIEQGPDDEQVEYQSGFFYVRGFQEKDVCQFMGGKLARYRPVRVESRQANNANP